VGAPALTRRCDVHAKYASHLAGYPSGGWVTPPCIWTLLSSLGNNEFFSVLLEGQEALGCWAARPFG